ncbi:hypothetical protein NQ176_g5824 [Zarea fungicola]|uniref:Uncharacterized protein n=1 Tax=Zarea fungicola TaxID=93591 RepID=A0ACC1N7P5_9HYPO|nr:hypothetical protein NQ176_g5824 [Lecanicillium fungicola]
MSGLERRHCCGETTKNNLLNVTTVSSTSDFPSELRRKRGVIQEPTTMAATDTWGTTDVQCRECRASEVKYTTLQLRSADEGTTMFYFCPKCSASKTEVRGANVEDAWTLVRNVCSAVELVRGAAIGGREAGRGRSQHTARHVEALRRITGRGLLRDEEETLAVGIAVDVVESLSIATCSARISRKASAAILDGAQGANCSARFDDEAQWQELLEGKVARIQFEVTGA